MLKIISITHAFGKSLIKIPTGIRKLKSFSIFPRAREAMLLSTQVQLPLNLLAITYWEVRAWVSVVSHLQLLL